MLVVSNNSSFIFNFKVCFQNSSFYAHFGQDFKSPILSLQGSCHGKLFDGAKISPK